MYLYTKFRQDISIHGWDINTSGFGKRTAAILEFYFRFRFWLTFNNGVSFCIGLQHFIHRSKVKYPWQRNDVISIFKDGGRQPLWAILDLILIDHPPSLVSACSSNFDLIGFIVSEIVRLFLRHYAALLRYCQRRFCPSIRPSVCPSYSWRDPLLNGPRYHYTFYIR